MIEREEVIGRLQDGNRGLQISSESRRGHVESMEELLSSFESSNKPTSSRRFAVPLPLRNSAVLLVAFGVGVAAAAYSDGVPGDPFYRAKRVAEQPAQIVDRDLVASNRLGELEELIDRGADPDTVLSARTDAANALLGGESADMAQALSLLAWPGGLDGRGVDVDATNESLLITESEWFNERGYSASLADGHLVTISVLDGDVLIATTGDWTVQTTGSGWLLTSAGMDQVYFIQRQGQALRVMASGPARSSGSEEGADELGAASLSTDRSRFRDPQGETRTGGDATLTPIGPRTSMTSDNEEAPGPAGVSRAEPVSTAAASAANPDGGSEERTAATTPPATAGSTSPRPEPQTTALPGPSPSTTGQPSTTKNPTTRAPTTRAPTTRAPTTKAPTTTAAPTTQGPTTVAPVSAMALYLENPGSGNTSSSRSLPLSDGSAPGGQLRNFDTNRDGEPGLLVKRDGGGLSVSDSTKSQEWTWTSSAAMAFEGEAKLTIWLAAQDFKDGERIGLLASIELCNQGCTRLGTAQWNGSAVEGEFRSATISFGSVYQSIPAGATLRLKVVVPDGLASTDVMFAYDSASHPSRLSIG